LIDRFVEALVDEQSRTAEALEGDARSVGHGH
jgi:hypothetical protein